MDAFGAQAQLPVSPGAWGSPAAAMQQPPQQVTCTGARMGMVSGHQNHTLIFYVQSLCVQGVVKLFNFLLFVSIALNSHSISHSNHPL